MCLTKRDRKVREVSTVTAEEAVARTSSVENCNRLFSVLFVEVVQCEKWRFSAGGVLQHPTTRGTMILVQGFFLETKWGELCPSPHITFAQSEDRGSIGMSPSWRNDELQNALVGLVVRNDAASSLQFPILGPAPAPAFAVSVMTPSLSFGGAGGPLSAESVF